MLEKDFVQVLHIESFTYSWLIEETKSDLVPSMSIASERPNSIMKLLPNAARQATSCLAKTRVGSRDQPIMPT